MLKAGVPSAVLRCTVSKFAPGPSMSIWVSIFCRAEVSVMTPVTPGAKLMMSSPAAPLAAAMAALSEPTPLSSVVVTVKMAARAGAWNTRSAQTRWIGKRMPGSISSADVSLKGATISSPHRLTPLTSPFWQDVRANIVRDVCRGQGWVNPKRELAYSPTVPSANDTLPAGPRASLVMRRRLHRSWIGFHFPPRD